MHEEGVDWERKEARGQEEERSERERKKEALSASTKDNIIRAPQNAVVAWVTKPWRLKCGWVFVSLSRGDRAADTTVTGSTWNTTLWCLLHRWKLDSIHSQHGLHANDATSFWWDFSATQTHKCTHCPRYTERKRCPSCTPVHRASWVSALAYCPIWSWLINTYTARTHGLDTYFLRGRYSYSAAPPRSALKNLNVQPGFWEIYFQVLALPQPNSVPFFRFLHAILRYACNEQWD